ncbi:MAG: inorganic phosphate transporter family protein [Verrucomicrobiales bacterium]|nr:inorganic phosphate transporter family protein [Verrucomicrobiales bacterium]
MSKIELPFTGGCVCGAIGYECSAEPLEMFFDCRPVPTYARMGIREAKRNLKDSMIALLFLATCFLAYSNGANDNFKGVASLFGSRTTGYRNAISWATLTTGAGSIAAIFLAQSLFKRFSGKGLVPDVLTTQPEFLLAVALGAGATVILATLLGFPISTTHGLTGALVGSGLIAGAGNVNFGALGKNFFTPLLLAPLIAVAAGAAAYSVFRALRLSFGISKEMCICVGTETEIVPVPRPDGLFAAEALPKLSITASQSAICQQRYTGTFLGVNAGRLVDAFHFLSAGAVSFARGLNDTPKIAALLLVASALDIRWGLLAVGFAMAVGGLLNARKVADTMAHKITEMNPGQGFAANLATALLVSTASYHGLPVSTTHVSVGSLLGIGITTRQAKWKPVIGVLWSWVVTLPCAAMLAALAYIALRLH